MSLFMVDVEADGPYPGDYSMVSFGVVKVQADLLVTPTLFGQVAPISENFHEDNLRVVGVSREQHLTYEPPEVVMPRLAVFLAQHSKGRPIFFSDNPAWDFQWINLYTHRYAGGNPFGHSGRRLGDLYAGMMRDMRHTEGWKRHRKTKHDHHPLRDAMGNAEALVDLAKLHGLKIGD